MLFQFALTLSVLSTLLPLTLANFDIYADHYKSWSSTNPQAGGFRIFGGDTNDPCKYVNKKDYIRWPKRDDVSGEKFGIRCEGSGCDYESADPNKIDRLEMHFSNNPLYHWTLYADNVAQKAPPLDGRWMFPSEVGPQAPGYCFPYPGDEYNCEHSAPDGPSGQVFVVGSKGKRLFRCITSIKNVYSDDINGPKLQGADTYYPYPDDGKKGN
ncbi:hypothetical protein SLS60_010890 [Paraconiothyrium brasiliense]|uniref:Uncharacterized protein n=1 Tax=Paraconiothyrium brasiliense TaxID=300254 RepID=A0ABR3QMA1_9PLEO